MNFELLPNETILDVFEYILTTDLFHSFSNLNTRFQQLLFIQFQKFCLDLRSISKANLHDLCQNYIPLIIDRIISLRLSNDHDTPREIEFFLSQHFQLRQFTRLKSISLSYVRPEQLFNQIMAECNYLPCLTHFTFNNDDVFMRELEPTHFFNQLWKFKNLTYCHLNISFAKQYEFPNLSVISTSLKHVIIRNSTFSTSALMHICHYTPNLQYLSIDIKDHSSPPELLLQTCSITRLIMYFNGTLEILTHLLQTMPNLSHLTCETHNIYMSGYQWEQIIQTYLPKLKIFHFNTNFSVSNVKYASVQLNEIVDTYRTKFWIDEHQWFIRCHWCTFEYSYENKRFDLFTVPYTFRKFSNDMNWRLTRSTCPMDEEYLTCDRVISLSYDSTNNRSSNLSRLYFPNLQHLTLELSSSNKFLTDFPNLDQLNSMHIYTTESTGLNDIQQQLQCLLNRAPCLHSMSTGGFFMFAHKEVLLEVSSASLCRLDLLATPFVVNKWSGLDDKPCIELCHSPLGKQCEVLLIQVQNRRNILDLVNNMPNLRALNVGCKEDNFHDTNCLVQSVDDELLNWLREQLPSTYTIERDTNGFKYIQIWIR